MPSQIHPTAIIDPQAQLDSDVTVGSYAVIGPHVKIHARAKIMSHVVVEGYTTIGKESLIYPHASIGSAPQDLRYKPCESYLTIGERTTVRESVTINPGASEGEVTSVGRDCFLMAFSHVAHNCKIKNNVTLANLATLGGYVTVDDYAMIGGLSGIHQFVRIGAHAMIGGMSPILQDVVPYGLVGGNPSKMSSVNIVGLKRRGFSEDDIMAIKQAHKWIFRSTLTVADAISKIHQKYASGPVIQVILDFLGEGRSQRGYTR